MDRVGDDRTAGIVRGVAVSWQSEHWGYTLTDWACIRNHFGEQGAAAG